MTDRLLVSVPGATLRDAIGPLPDGVEVVRVGPRGAAARGRHLDLVVPPYMGASARLGALAGVTTRLVQSQSIGYDDVAGGAAARARLRERGDRARDLDRRAHARARARRAARHPRLRARRAARAAGRRPGTRASPTGACCSSATAASAAPSRSGSLPFEVELTRVASRARDDERGRIHGIDELPDAAARRRDRHRRRAR